MKKKKTLILISILVVIILILSGILLWPKSKNKDDIRVLEVWLEAPNSNKIYCHVHEPADASEMNKYPALVMVPGGSGTGTQFDNGQADEIVKKGFVVMHFDPEGRGKSEGQENYNGFKHQDDLYAAIVYLKSLEEVNDDNIGIFTRSYGITIGSGTLARYTELGVKYLIDWEGPSNRTQHYMDRDGDGIPDSHLPVVKDGTVKITDDTFWNEREASTFIRNITADYLRIQGEIDHAQDTSKGHAIDMLNSASEGKSPWTRCNDNPANMIYDPQNVEQYIWLSGRADERHRDTILSWIVEMSER